jgi:transcriptional regulator with XRE-family HTH domain
MDFPQRLAALRKERGFTQPALAEAVSLHVSQLRRYEAGTSQPTLDVLRRLAMVLGVSADLLLFDRDERGPDEELCYLLEAARRLEPDEKRILKVVIEGILLKHAAKRWSSA